jgi:ketosteroid isomerase-like protein
MMSAQVSVDDRAAAVCAAADELIDAFGSHDVARYFDCFADNATMLFHANAQVMASRAEYEAEWASWEATGFRVHSCQSSEQRVNFYNDVAVFTHRVLTHLTDADGDHITHERETIVFEQSPVGRWLVVHEHLSIDAH